MKDTNEVKNTKDIKIGDFVKLKEWNDFLFVCDISGDYLEIEQKFNGQVYKTWYSISLGFIKQGDEMKEEKQEVQKQDEFQVGDIVWSTVYGKGKISTIDSDIYCIGVKSDTDEGFSYYTKDGKYDITGPRCLFFSEPKIEAAVTRPFVPTLVGKRVVVESERLVLMMACTVVSETHDMLYVIDESGDKYHWTKADISAIYEVQSENLLKK